jgi:hypothetical protein
MKTRVGCVVAGFLWLAVSVAAQFSAQQTTVATASTIVPSLVNFSSVLTDLNGKPLTGITGVTFHLYKEEQGGAPLWLETQSVQPDETGHYSVMLGSTTSSGLPGGLFVAGEARWLGVQAQGQAEQPRVMLLSVPYAMKAVDAETIGGLPPSAFVRATPSAATSGTGIGVMTGTVSKTGPSAGRQNVSGKTVSPAIQTQSYVAKFINGTGGLGNSLIFDNGTNVGVATTAPGFPLDVAGIVNAQKDIQGLGDLRVDFKSLNKGSYSPGIRFGSGNTGEGISSARGGTTNVYGIDIYTKYLPRVSVTNGGNVGIGTATPASMLDVHGTGNFTGLVTFASGQTFPGAAELTAANTFTGNQTVNGNLTATGVVTGSSFQIGNNLFAYGSSLTRNALLGFAGNTTMTGNSNTASGSAALSHNTTGSFNTANGVGALYDNTTGHHNTGSGFMALYFNSTGYYNTAIGLAALWGNSTGSANTAIGLEALYTNGTGFDNTSVGYAALSANTIGSDNTAVGFLAGQPLDSSSVTANYNTFLGSGAVGSTGTLTNATAIGAKAEVAASNALVLGSINGLNHATADTYVGIGTTAPSAKLSVSGAETTAGGFGAAIKLSNSAAGGANWYLRAGATGTNTPAGGLSIANDSLYAVAINSSGQVGIGTETPANTLEVVAGGTTLADAWTTRSSRRFKTNIHTLHGALDKVEQLRGVSYDLKESGKHEVGVIAEEVGAVVPEVVTWEKNGKDAQGVDYSRLTALLIEATKEQQTLIREQQKQLQAQEVRIAELTSEVMAVKASLKARHASGSEVQRVNAQKPLMRQ